MGAGLGLMLNPGKAHETKFRPTLLVVEDNDSMRDAAANMIGEMGNKAPSHLSKI